MSDIPNRTNPNAIANHIICIFDGIIELVISHKMAIEK
jgi:hypothetical protein